MDLGIIWTHKSTQGPSGGIIPTSKHTSPRNIDIPEK